MTEAILLLAPAVCATAIADRTRARRLSVRPQECPGDNHSVRVPAVLHCQEALLANRFRVESAPGGREGA